MKKKREDKVESKGGLLARLKAGGMPSPGGEPDYLVSDSGEISKPKSKKKKTILRKKKDTEEETAPLYGPPL